MDNIKKREELSYSIYRRMRGRIYQKYSFLAGVLAGLDPLFEYSGRAAEAADKEMQPGEKEPLLSTDGEKIYAESTAWIERYYQDQNQLFYELMHMLLHLGYLHIFREDPNDKEYWDIACDFFVYRILRDEYGLEQRSSVCKEECLQLLQEKHSVQQIIKTIKEETFPYHKRQLEDEFQVDSHVRWLSSHAQGSRGLRQKWEKIRAYTSSGLEHASTTAGSSRGYDVEMINIVKEPRDNYHSFLKRFMETREEVMLDHDSFDYIYYNFGIENFQNMPFIEPLEYREVQRLYELVIAIDTSGSCKRETVERFLNETYGIFADEENFFSKVCVYIVQCDCAVQDIQLVTSVEQWKKASGNIKIVGRGGTDFTPVFLQIETWKAEKKLKNLKALIYFTDGDGVYPEIKPDYETAFVSDRAFTAKIPNWIKTYQITTEKEAGSGRRRGSCEY